MKAGRWGGGWSDVSIEKYSFLLYNYQMENKRLKLGDLVKPERLKKPAEGVATEELGAKPEKIKRLADKISGMAANIEGDTDVKAGEVVNLIDAMKKSLVKELAPEKAKELLKTLMKRFYNKDYATQGEHIKAIAGIKWEDVQKRLEAHPEKLWSLSEMERTGGEPDVFGYDKKNDEYIFVDFSAESPTGRRNCCYDRVGQQEAEERGEKPNGNAISMAAMMGIDLLTESEYRELQERGEFDKSTWSWLKTPIDERKKGVALFGARHGDDVHVYEDYPYLHRDLRAFRCSLRV